MSILSSIENKIIVESFTDKETGAGVKFVVVDYKYPFCKKNNIRRIEFQNGESYLYSSVYLSEKRDFQPMYPCAQRMIDCFFDKSGVDDALVLGCAGCTFPRFLINRYADCEVTGVEYSSQIIEIAKKYFITDKMKSRFEIVNDDAFMYIKEVPERRFDLVFVDIFVAEKIHSSIFSESFISDLYRICGENSMAVFNLFGVGEGKAQRFVESLDVPFDNMYVIEDYRKFFLALTKCKDISRTERFEKKITHYADIRFKK
ncbi:MAG: hypothetical protein J6O40_03650 [Ruminococcus sp.]|nr:hypothetical protein [Ruminococcus sp.]